MNFAAVGADGRTFASSRPYGPEGPPDMSGQPFFKALIDAGTLRYITDPHVGPISGEMVTALLIPLLDSQNRFNGIVAMSISLADLSQVWTSAPLHDGLSIAVIDRSGTIIFANSGGPLAPNTKIGDLPGLQDRQALAQGVATVRLSGRMYDVWTESVPVAGWTLLVLGASTGEFMGYLHHSPIVGGMGLAIMSLAAAGLFLSRREAFYHRRLYESEGRLRLHRDQLELTVANRTAELAASEARYRQIVETAQEGIWVLDAEGKTAFVNAKMAEMFGCEPEAMMGELLLAFMDETNHALAVEYLVRRRQGISEQHDFRFRRKDGSEFWALLATSPLFDEADVYTGALAMVTDITDRKRMEHELSNSRQLLKLILDTLPTRVFWKDRNLNYLGGNKIFALDTGLSSPEELSGKSDFDLLDEEYAERYRAEDLSVIESGKALMDIEGSVAMVDGRTLWLRTCKLPLLEVDGKIGGVIGTYDDITEQKSHEERLKHLATHDGLTGLANRALMQDRLQQSIHYAHRSGRQVAVLLLDLDRFKVINDSLGHDFGDQLLCAAAERLQQSVREADTVARMGGDEFVVVLAEVAEPEDVGIVATKILRNLAKPLTIEGREVAVTASLGISLYPRDSEDAGTLIRNADMAMYRAKRGERSTFAFYSPEMNKHVLGTLELENALRQALEREEFCLHYQPKIDLNSGRIVGCEALVRWRHPQRGMMSPADFIPLAEETGLIVPLGAWVLKEACRQVQFWQREGLPTLSVAVNLSARQFRKGDLPQQVRDILHDVGLDPRLLELELTESMVMDNPVGAEQTMRVLKELGVGLSLDDFGTGYSSLNYLRRFPVDSLKIDRSFIHDVATDPSGASVVTSVINIAHNLGLKAVAEGVETQEQLAFLVGCDCDQYQGYLFSKPLSAEKFADLLREGVG